MTDALGDAAQEAYVAGLAAVDPTVLVRKAVRQGLLDDWFVSLEKPKSIRVLALGKAAPRMLWGLVEASVPFGGLGVAPKGMPAPNVDTVTWLSGDHPIPGEQSFAAGQRLTEWAKSFPKDEPLLVLLSGGASACVEHPEGVETKELQQKWRDWLHGGLGIEAMNGDRTKLSALKGGKLGRILLERTSKIRVWILADTDPTAAAQTVGSAPFFQANEPTRIPHHVLASGHEMVGAAGLRLATLGYQVYRHARRIEDDAAGEIAAFLTAADGLPKGQPAALVGVGEALVATPTTAPPGGRCQHTALFAAHWLQAHNSSLTFMAAATDGIDGSTDAAGATVTAADWTAGAEEALRHFDAHRFLDRRGRLLHMGPTGTNVNDLWVALRR